MKADFTRSTFDPRKQFTRVLMQQGRVQLDSDWNEQVAILLHYMRTLAADIIGPHAGPEDGYGFEVLVSEDDLPDDLSVAEKERLKERLGKLDPGDFLIGKGRYYIDGILCENGRDDATYRRQPYYPLPEGEDDLPGSPFLVYLDVWEHHVTDIEDFDIREVALGGPDTATRARVVWQVRIDGGPDESDGNGGSDGEYELDRDSIENSWDKWVERWQPANRGMLKAKGREDLDEDSDPCIVSPEARYRGAENQLYRVEIHRSGNAVPPDDESDTRPRRETGDYASGTDANAGVATFKWSRDNGSVTFAIRDLEGSMVTLESLGRDDHLSLKVGDLVEVVDEDYVLQERAEPLLRVEEIDATNMRVTLSNEPYSGVGRDPAKHPLLLRRWDHGASSSRNGVPGSDTLPLREDDWLTLEDGVRIHFQSAPEQEKPNHYRTGDYWLIPARTATGDVEWPGDAGQPEARPPHGIEHHYAPVAVVENGNAEDRRHVFVPIRT